MPLNPGGGVPIDLEALLRPAEPFETEPHIAIGVSGGADSMALALLAARWARKRGGRATGLIVDHGLRSNAAAEAKRVANWLRQRNIDHRILTWHGTKPETGVQTAAREARYSLLTNWCRRHGVLHLLVGHQLEDQAETVVLRLERGSGVDGLAAMPPAMETPWVRILRPLLGHTRAQLREFLVSEGQEWIEDPSNRDTAFARVRVREALSVQDNEGRGGDVTNHRLASTASRLGQARQALERETARLLAETAEVYPTGHAMIDLPLLASASPDIGMRALSRILTCIGGGMYGPRRERLERLYAHIVEGRLARGATLGGCLLSPQRGRVLVAREPKAIHESLTVAAPGEVVWDSRFRLSLRSDGSPGPKTVTVSALGDRGWSELCENRPDLRRSPIPARVRHGLPALWSGSRLVGAPHLGLQVRMGPRTPEIRCEARFWPRYSLAGAEFSVV